MHLSLIGNLSFELKQASESTPVAWSNYLWSLMVQALLAFQKLGVGVCSAVSIFLCQFIGRPLGPWELTVYKSITANLPFLNLNLLLSKEMLTFNHQRPTHISFSHWPAIVFGHIVEHLFRFVFVLWGCTKKHVLLFLHPVQKNRRLCVEQ